MAIYKSLTELVGKTPILELTHIEEAEGLKATVLAKLEYFNPAGSVKDRIAKQMIEDAEADGKLGPGSRAAPSSSRPAATRASVSRRSRRQEGTGSSSPCRRR